MSGSISNAMQRLFSSFFLYEREVVIDSETGILLGQLKRLYVQKIVILLLL